ncbi:hypothetical protein Tco_1040116 [Tanacetum coccineum]
MDNENKRDNLLNLNLIPLTSPEYNQDKKQGNGPVQHFGDNAAKIHENEIGEDGLIDIDIEIEGGDEVLNFLRFFPWEDLAFPPHPNQEAESALRTQEVVLNQVIPGQNMIL